MKFIKVLSVFILSGIMLSAYAKNDSLSLQLIKCSEIAQAESRLNCFDALAKTQNIAQLSAVKASKKATSVAETTSAVVSVQTASAPQPPVAKVANTSEQKKVDDFAKEQLKTPDEQKGLESISAKIVKLKQRLRGEWVLDLDNGQQWQQKGSGNIKLKVGNTVQLEKGALGVIYLRKEGSHRSIRVKRLK